MSSVTSVEHIAHPPSCRSRSSSLRSLLSTLGSSHSLSSVYDRYAVAFHYLIIYGVEPCSIHASSRSDPALCLQHTSCMVILPPAQHRRTLPIGSDELEVVLDRKGSSSMSARTQTAEEAYGFSLHRVPHYGVYVTSVLPGGAAEAAGVQCGDQV
jgi:hypothetical protein